MRLILTGGGTGGHIVRNIAIINELKIKFEQKQLELLYIGERQGLEESLITRMNVKFRGIFCGKLRRYVSFKNFIDFFKLPIGVLQSLFLIFVFKPDVIFSSGGYVSFPVVFAGWILRIPIVVHEADVLPGLANRLAFRFATRICLSFEESKKFVKNLTKVSITGNPVRKGINNGNKKKGLDILEFSDVIPIILIMGGSQGAQFINNFVWNNLGKLLEKYQIIHICGEGNMLFESDILRFLDDDHKGLFSRYKNFGFVGDELKHFYKTADLIVSRAGAMSLAEIDAVLKPSILIPLGTQGSRGDQIYNANAFIKHHDSVVIQEKNFNFDDFIVNIDKCLKCNDFSKLHKKSLALNNVISVILSVYEDRN